MRTRIALLLALAGLALAGCSSAIAGRPDADPPPELTAPSGQIVFQVVTSPGYAPADYVLASRPSVTVYGDGRAFVLDPTLRRAWSGQPLRFLAGRVDRATLVGLVADAHRSGLFDDVDFGDPNITDLGTTGITFRPGQDEAVRASAYALGAEDESGSGVTDEQLRLRERLGDFIAQVDDAVTGRSAWQPDRIDVRVATADSGDAPQQWPGPELSRVLGNVRTTDDRTECGVLTGADAQRVFAAAYESSSTAWTDGGRTVDLVIRALLPGESACAR